MPFWSRWFQPRSEAKMSSLELFREIYGGRVASTGKTVTWANALEVATVLACCRVIAEGVAQVPWRLYVDGNGDERRMAKDHPLYRVIYRRPNRWQTSFEFRETLAFHLCIFSNAYVYVGRVGSNRKVLELAPLEPQFVRVEKKDDGALIYKYSPLSGPAVEFSGEEIWHLRGASWNGWSGMPAVTLLRETIALAMAAESAHSEMHKSGARVGGMISVDGTLSKERYDFLSAWLDKYAMGGDRAGKPLILDQGAKWAAQQMTGVDAQHLETRYHQIREICSGFRVQPIMIGYSDKAATYASAEQMFIAHVVHTLSPWYERIEQSADEALLSDEDKQAGFYTKFTPNALMRGAARDRADFYTRMVGSVNATPGIMTIDEIRGLEELAPMGGDAAKLFMPKVDAVPEAKPKMDTD